MKTSRTEPALDTADGSPRPPSSGDSASLVCRVRSRVMVALAVAVCSMTLTTLHAPAAQAHDTLVSSNPTAGSTVDQLPATVTLTFDQPGIGVGSIMVVTGPSGDARAGALRLVDRTVTQDLAAGSPAGEYKVIWRITSADGHPVSGQFTFTATHPSTGNQPAPTTGPPGPSAAAAPATPASTAVQASAGPPPWAIAILALAGIAAITLGISLLARRRRSPAGRTKYPRPKTSDRGGES